MELWDAYGAAFHKVEGKTLVRGEPIPEGLFHLAGDLIVRQTDGAYLPMQLFIEKLK